MKKECCHYDQNCAKIIVKCGFVYIIDDYGGSVKVEENDFNSVVSRYKEHKNKLKETIK